MAVDLSKLPPVLPVSVRRVNPDGTPSKESIDWEQYTRDFFKRTTVDLDTRLTTVTATAGANSAAITNEVNARASADAAQAQQINTVSVATGQNTASISTEINARISADAALAQATQTLTTVVNGNTAQLQVQASSINGLEVRYSVVGSINGSTGGFIFSGIQQNDGGAIFSTEFYSNVIIHGDVMINGTLTTPKAQNNAWTDAGYVTAGAVAAISTSALWRAGAKICIRAVAYPVAGYTDTAVVAPPGFMRIHVNGTALVVVAPAVANDTIYNGTVNTTYWKLLPSIAEFVYSVPVTGVYTIIVNFDTGNAASWGLVWEELAK